ncbi:hypothetical protein HG536_0B01860 [Torulaspora globosa]|uniref:Dilute domain-containing protein n=1 Tax=Torulaspora globosa TaxID=48254 RepID=A0A7G3ZCT7_9SACH|nr:uncharacterized protein HG536_0B01860 [Torulaspora globosa]QLL31323.1 hypothetical protein HG536_0B01860 [Torulaspora globosa]
MVRHIGIVEAIGGVELDLVVSKRMDDIWSQATSSVGVDGAPCDKSAVVKATTDELRKIDSEALEADPWAKLVLLMADNRPGEEELVAFRELLETVGDINDVARTGVALIHYAIVYDHAPYIELLHQQSKQPILNLLDSLVGYTPLMWCVQLNRQDCCVELFSFIDEIDFGKRSSDGLKAADMVVPGSAMAAFLDQNNFSQYERGSSGPVHLPMDGLSLNAVSAKLDRSDNIGAFGEFEEFEFDKISKNQYLELADYDIPQILDLLISLSRTHQHVTTYPAALLFQCIRYADHKLASAPLVESLIHLSLTRIIATASVEVNPESESQGDIVTQSYWLSAVSFLYYYLCRDEGFFKKYPSALQDIVNTLHTLMTEIVSATHSRLVPLMEPTLLSYTTIEDVKQTLYKRDWNFFKKRKQAKQLALLEKKRNDPRFYDDEVLRHLYPPSLEEQMKLSPMKIVQIFGALSYVLDLHQIHPLFQQQCLSTVINWFSSTLFNKIMKDKKKKALSRAHAIQIRLNLSSLETWIRNNDLTVPKPVLIDNFLWQRFPFTLVCDLNNIDLSNPPIRNVATYRPVDTDPSTDDVPIVSDTSNSLFYYQPFHEITKIHLDPVLQLLQWLQIATTLTNEESLDTTLALLPRLNPVQLLKSIDKYNYEVDESKFNSSLRKKISNAAKSRAAKEEAYLPERQSPALVLPTVAELTDAYSRSSNSRSFQPLLPMDIQDSVYEIHEENSSLRRTDSSYNLNGSKTDEQDDAEQELKYSSNGNQQDGHKADEYFKELDTPLASVQRPAWAADDEIEANPW